MKFVTVLVTVATMGFGRELSRSGDDHQLQCQSGTGSPPTEAGVTFTTSPADGTFNSP
jgi:hypothetical protein